MVYYSSFDLSSLWGFPLVAAYIASLVLLAGYWLEKKELLLILIVAYQSERE
ncbi:MAG TPA: hypothetical protein VKT25_03925 [Ktedonobacteraceae bacterium]|nr:hypothetical protein [Ktedonobacteraceae bacterium]